jgi:hypothetical protein
MKAFNNLAVGPDNLAWNGTPVSAATLRNYLQQMNQMNSALSLQLVFDDRANCRLVEQTRALLTNELGCGSGRGCVEYSEADYQREASRHVVY